MKRVVLGVAALALLGMCTVLTAAVLLYGMWQRAAASSVPPVAVAAEEHLIADDSELLIADTVLAASEPDMSPTDEPIEPTPEPAVPTPEPATPTPEPVVASNSATADDFRISLIKAAEGDEALGDLASSQWIEHVMSMKSIPGQREGWKLFEAQFAIENLTPFVRQAPQLCALLTDSGGYARVEPVDDDTCPGNRCGPRYDKSGPELQPDRDLWAASGVRYNGLRVFMELPITMQPATMTLYTSSSGNCADQEMATSWGVYDFTQPTTSVAFPFDAPPDWIATVGDGNSSIWYGDVGISIDNIRIESNQFGQDSFVLIADATYTNEGGIDVDTNQYPVYALTVHQSGKYIGKHEGFDGVIPPGVPKTFQVHFGYVDKADYAGSWFYVIFIDGAGNPIGQAQVEMPADITWAP